MGSTFNTGVSLVLLALMAWALFNVALSGAKLIIKLLWVLLIAGLPVLGLIIWAIAGPRRRSNANPSRS